MTGRAREDVNGEDANAGREVHACGIVGDHVASCGECGATRPLGWAHVCRPCWEAYIASDTTFELTPMKRTEHRARVVRDQLGTARPLSDKAAAAMGQYFEELIGGEAS